MASATISAPIILPFILSVERTPGMFAVSDAPGLSMQDERRMLHAVYRVGMYFCPAQTVSSSICSHYFN